MPPTETESNVATAPVSMRSSGTPAAYVVPESALPVSDAPSATTNGLPAVWCGIFQSSVKVTVPRNVWLAMFMPVSEASEYVAVAPPANTGATAAFSTRYVPANCTGQLNVTSSSESVTIFATVSGSVPPTAMGEAFWKMTVSVEAGAAAGATPSTSQLPGADQSTPLAPFHTYAPAPAPPA